MAGVRIRPGEGRRHRSGWTRVAVRAVAVAILASVLLGGLPDAPRTSAFTPRAPILIDGDGDFTAGNGVVGGSGTAGDPYLIQEWEINASASHGIVVRNTRAHFVVSGVYVHSGGGAFDGVRFENVANGAVRNSTFAGNAYGVAVAASGNVTVARNNLTGHSWGIAAMGNATDVAILNNSIASTSGPGILLAFVSNVTASGNAVTSSQPGIVVESSDGATVSLNRPFRNTGPGILVSRSTQSTLFANRVGEDSLEVRDSRDIDLVRNGVVAGQGILVVASQSILIVESVLGFNAPYGVTLLGSVDVAVYHNEFAFNGALDDGTANRWDDGYPSGGNYWWDYTGADLCSGPVQDVCPEPDGIGDFPHPFDPNSVDRYPLMGPRPEYVPPAAPTLRSAVLAGAGNADLALAWNASADEGVPGGTVEYRILRAADARGPYAPVATVAGNGSAAYAYTCAGCGHNATVLGNAFYKVRAADAANNTADSGLAGRYARGVTPGGNLLAVPLIQQDWSLAAVLRTFSYGTVRTYRSSDPADPWKAYYPSRPGDLGPIGLGDALWVNVVVGGTYTIAGLVPGNASLVLEPGWNLLAYVAANGRTRDASLGGVPGVVTVETFDPGTPGPYRLRTVAGGDALLPGDPYWVLTTQRATWDQG